MIILALVNRGVF